MCPITPRQWKSFNHSLCTRLICTCKSEFHLYGPYLHPSYGQQKGFGTSIPWSVFLCFVRACFVRNSCSHPGTSHLNFSILIGCLLAMCFPMCSKSDSQSGHRLGLSVLKVGALGFQSSHNESHFFLSCAMCAQILLSNSGSPAKPLIAWITRSFRSPVRMPLRPCKDPKSVCLAGLEGAMRATCPIHLACRLPTKILQSGTPNLRAHSSLKL